MQYYLLIMCENCDEEIYYGVNVTYIEHNGLPVIFAEAGATTSFYCEACEHTTVTGDLDKFDSENM